MALDIQDVSYAGKFASSFWLPATFGMDTIEKGVVHVADGIKKKLTIGRINTLNPLQERTATPTAGGTFTIDGRDLNPQDIMVYFEFNPRDFEQHWLAEELSPTLLARELPVTAENYMMQIALSRSMEQLENGIWQGSTTYTAAVGSPGNGQIKFFDGFIKKFLADATVQKVANPFPLTAAPTAGSLYNIVDAMDALLNLATTNKKALLSGSKRYENMKFLVPYSAEQIYQTFLTTTQTFKGVNTTERGINRYKGYEVVPVAGMPDNTIVFTRATDDFDSNLWVGMNSTEDNDLMLAKLQPNSELFFMKGLMKYDVEYGWSDEVFLFTTLTTGSFNA